MSFLVKASTFANKDELIQMSVDHLTSLDEKVEHNFLLHFYYLLEVDLWFFIKDNYSLPFLKSLKDKIFYAHPKDIYLRMLQYHFYVSSRWYHPTTLHISSEVCSELIDGISVVHCFTVTDKGKIQHLEHTFRRCPFRVHPY